MLTRTTRLYTATICTIVALSGCSRTINRTTERRIQEVLPRLFGTSKQYLVRIDSRPERTLRGRASHLIIDGVDVLLPDGVMVDSLHLELDGVEFDTRHRQLKRVKEARFTLSFSETTLDMILASRLPSDSLFHTPRVSLRDDVISVTGTRRELGLSFPVKLTGQLHVTEGFRLKFDADSARFAGLPVPSADIRQLKDKLEYAVDLSMLPFRVQISTVYARNGQLILNGTVDVNKILDQVRRPEKR